MSINSDLIRRAVLTWLARRDYSQREITQKLAGKGYHRDEIDPIITAFIQADLINDLRFTENYTAWRRNKGFGPERITMELQTRGIDHETIAQVLEIADNAWFAAARKVWHKRFKGKLPIDFKDRAKQMRFLQYRGFTQEQIASVLNEEEFVDD